jgi:SAM-dependent methyltransferase
MQFCADVRVNSSLRLIPVEVCPVCQSDRILPMMIVEDRRYGVPGNFKYDRCDVCYTVFQGPVVSPQDIEQCYPNNYYTHIPLTELNPSDLHSSHRGFSSARNRLRANIVAAIQGSSTRGAMPFVARMLARIRRMRERAFYGILDELIPRSPSVGRALELGCGSGNLLVALDRAGWKVEGLDRDPASAEIARKVSGCRVHVGDLFESRLPLRNYDLIVLNHVFEHLAEPGRALQRLYDLLDHGGRAVLLYPNPASVSARLLGSSWPHWDPPRHLVLPAGPALRALAESIGFDCVCYRTRSSRTSLLFATGRAYSAGHAVEHQRVGPLDRVLALAETVPVALGFDVGNELVLALTK